MSLEKKPILPLKFRANFITPWLENAFRVLQDSPFLLK